MIAVESYASLDQASSALGPTTVYLGGGTLVMRALNYGEQDFDRIILSTDPALHQISQEGNRIRIGAGVTMTALVQAPELAYLAPVARQVGGPAIRNMATVGGNLFARHPYGDLTTALLALNGTVQTLGGGEQDLESFLSQRSSFRGIVASVTIDRVQNPAEFRWRKVNRVKPKGVAMLSIAALLPHATGRISGARIAFLGMADGPRRAKAVEQALEGANLDASGVQNALAALASEFDPPDDALASGWYRREVAPIHLRRLLLNEEVR